MELTYNQRQFVFERFSRAFGHYKLYKDKKITDLLGPATQTLLKEALHTYCFVYPLKPTVVDKDLGLNSEKKKNIQKFYKFDVEINLPVSLPLFGEKIKLSEEIPKETLESK